MMGRAEERSLGEARSRMHAVQSELAPRLQRANQVDAAGFEPVDRARPIAAAEQVVAAAQLLAPIGLAELG